MECSLFFFEASAGLIFFAVRAVTEKLKTERLQGQRSMTQVIMN